MLNDKCKMSTLILAFLLSVTAQAQQRDSIDECQFVVVYDHLIHTFDKEGKAVTDSVQIAVQVGQHVTKCAEFNLTMMNDFGEGSNKEYQLGEWYARLKNVPTVFLNHPEGEMRVFDKVVPQRYTISGALPEIPWQLSEDTLTIGGYLCHRATGRYAGRTWTVWYTDEIPSSAGPWKLRGLPGMILQASDEGGVHTFTFAGLLNRQTPICYHEGNNRQGITLDKFIAHRNKVLCNKRYPQNPRYYLPEGTLDGAIEMWPGGPEPAPEDKLTVLAIDMVVPKTAYVYQPLELE